MARVPECDSAHGTLAIGGDEGLDHQALAASYLKDHGLLEADLSFHKLVDTADYARLSLGSFEVRVPVDGLGDALQAKRVRDGMQALVSIQEHWFEWNGRAKPGAEKDWQLVFKWIGSWTPRKLAKLYGGEDSILTQLEAPAKIVEAVARLHAWTAYGGELAKTLGERNLTVLAPTRKHFLQLSSVSGLLRKDLRPEIWRDGLIRYGASWVDFDQIIALENFAFPINWNDPFAGRDLDEADPDGLKQFVADRAATVLLRRQFYHHGTHFFEEAVATNLIIAYLGKNSNGPPEFDFKYKQAGGRTEAYERFVPGGNPGGGTLPPRKAQRGPLQMEGNFGTLGIYRANEGEDFFAAPLCEGQKKGAKGAQKLKDVPLRNDKRAHFELTSLETTQNTVVSAPFLGEVASSKSLPSHEFLDDYEDFFRAYRACFVHWLRTKAEGPRSAALFAELIQAHADRKLGATLDAVVLQVYGIPLSGNDGENDSLEWRFLEWLRKGGR